MRIKALKIFEQQIFLKTIIFDLLHKYTQYLKSPKFKGFKDPSKGFVGHTERRLFNAERYSTIKLLLGVPLSARLIDYMYVSTHFYRRHVHCEWLCSIRL